MILLIIIQLNSPLRENGQLFFGMLIVLRVASPTAVKNSGRDYGTKVAVGTGPFIMESFKAKDHLHLTRNPNYYRKGLPCLDGFRAKMIPSGSVRILKLKKGELDTINTFQSHNSHNSKEVI